MMSGQQPKLCAFVGMPQADLPQSGSGLLAADQRPAKGVGMFLLSAVAARPYRHVRCNALPCFRSERIEAEDR
jgi:hypothetical protein